MSGGDRANSWKGQRVQNALLAHVNNSAVQEASKEDDTVFSYIPRATTAKIRAVRSPALISTGYDPQKWLFNSHIHGLESCEQEFIQWRLKILKLKKKIK